MKTLSQNFDEMYENAASVEERIQLALNMDVIIAGTIEAGDTVRDFYRGEEWIVIDWRDDMGCGVHGRLYRMTNGRWEALKFDDEIELVKKAPTFEKATAYVLDAKTLKKAARKSRR